jgi:hypothetical protein
MNTTELTEMRDTAAKLGVLGDWEQGFLNDVIRRGKKLSSKQMNICNRIAVKIANYDESKVPQWVKILQVALSDEQFQCSDWSRRFGNDMVQRGMGGREVTSFSTRQQELLNALVKEAEEWGANKGDILAKREQDIKKRAEETAARRAEYEARIKLQKTIITLEGFERVHALIQSAATKLKHPSITVTVTVESGKEVSLCLQGSQQSDIVKIRSSHKKAAIDYGFINADGLFTFNGLLSQEHLEAAQMVAKDPLTAIIEYGHATGSCSFCRRDLTDIRSVSVGYGPVCAKRYSLPWSTVSVTAMTEYMVAKAQSVRSIVASDDAIKTTQSIKCDDCSKYVLHPSDYDTQVKRGNGEYYCCNGCSAPVFEVADEKCAARFVVETPAEIIDAYKAAFGLDSISEVDSSSLQAFSPSEAVEEASEPAEDESPAQPSEESSDKMKVYEAAAAVVGENLEAQKDLINEVTGDAVKATGAKPDDGLFWTNDGKSFKSRQGRYNYCKRTGAQYL